MKSCVITWFLFINRLLYHHCPLDETSMSRVYQRMVGGVLKLLACRGFVTHGSLGRNRRVLARSLSFQVDTSIRQRQRLVLRKNPKDMRMIGHEPVHFFNMI